MTEVKEANRAYLTNFERVEKELARSGPHSVHRLRQAAIARFGEMGFPTARDEEWRFTPLTSLLSVPHELGPEGQPPHVIEGYPKLHYHEPGPLLHSYNGHTPYLVPSSRPLPPGVLVCNLAEALDKHPDLVEPYLGQFADYKNHAFTALNTAFLRDGAFVFVPPGTIVEQPIYLNFLITAFSVTGRYAWYRRSLVVAGEQSQVTIAEVYKGLPYAAHLTNAVTEIVVGKNAIVDHYKIQQEGSGAFHMATMHVNLDRAANFSSHAVTLGGSWVRNEINAVFADEGGECTLNGLYQASGNQLIDNHTMIDHAQPRCASHELYKGILDGKSRGVFNGKIQVRQDAQKTDAKQTNQTLLLSDDATINTKPQLEIYADDVKCTHGATVGQLDEESVFYLRTRGIGREQARALLTYAFANDIVRRIKVDPLRQQLEQTFLAAGQLPEVGTVEEKS